MMNRRAKRDVIVINDEEAAREQPPEKIVKEEAESVPSPDVAQLQQQLLKSDKKFKRVCEMAGEYKARVEFLEKIIDTKEGIVGNANGEESREELKNKVAELTKQLEEQRKDHDSEVERAEELRVSKDREMKLITEENQQLIRANTELKNRIASLKDEMYSLQQKLNLEKDSLQKKLDDAIKLNEELVENGANIHRNELPIAEDLMGETLFEDGVNAMVDPEDDSFNLSSNGKDESDSDETEDSDDTESLDESKLLVKKKTNAKSEKKIDNKRRSDVDESSSNPSSKVVRKAKVNHAELECPKCDYRSRSVMGFLCHLRDVHSTSPRQLGLALLCECGTETFSDWHSRVCEVSRITVVRKSATPKCVMCEVYPKTACGYACHLSDHHNTTPKKLGLFLVCSCGHKVTTTSADPEHTKKCNGHEFALHKVDDE